MLLWLDIETTGLNPRTYSLLEVGLVLTDDNLVKQSSWSAILPYAGVPEAFIAKMHGPPEAGGSGLLAECAKRFAWHDVGGMHSEDVVENDRRRVALHRSMIDWLEQNLVGLPKPPLAGSSVHFDVSFIRESGFAPLMDFVSYHQVDVSSVKELAARWAPNIVETRPKPATRHRAFPDIDDSLAELAHYRKHLFAI